MKRNTTISRLLDSHHVVLCLIFTAVFLLGAFDSAHAAKRQRKSDALMKRYCMYVGAKLSGLAEFKASIKALIATIEKLNTDIVDINAQIKPPSLQCLDTLNGGNVNLSLPTLQGVSACFKDLIPTISYPSLSDVNRCLDNLIPQISYKYPTSFDPRACLPSITAPDLSQILEDIYAQLEAILAALKQLLASLKKLEATVDHRFNDGFFANLKILASMCKSAKVRSRVSR